MFSVLCNLLEPNVAIGSHVIGVGTTSMNYSGNPYNGNPGNDTNSIGFSDDGNYYFNGNVVQSGLPTWTNGDTIDIAISHGQYWWIRVNGGNWNNNPSANPTTLSNGLTMNGLTNFYPVLCPAYQGIMTVLNYPKYGVPSDYNFLGNVTASLKFFRSANLTDGSFINIAEYVANQNGTPQTFTGATEASSWLTTNGFWNSYGQVVTSNLELYLNPSNSLSYPGSGTIWYDLSGLGHDTTLEGNPTLPTFVSSPIKSFLFVQSGAYGSANRIETSSNFLGNDMTLQCWVNTTVVGNDTAHYRLAYIMGAEVGGAGNDWGFGVNNSGKLAFGNGTNDVTINTTASVNTGQWINVAATRTESTGSISLYINGILDTTSTGPTANNTLDAASQIWIGCGQDGPATSIGGNIGIVLAYSSVLNSTEILSNYNSTKSNYGY
jgi:hypothetical protein